MGGGGGRGGGGGGGGGGVGGGGRVPGLHAQGGRLTLFALRVPLPRIACIHAFHALCVTCQSTTSPHRLVRILLGFFPAAAVPATSPPLVSTSMRPPTSPTLPFCRPRLALFRPRSSPSSWSRAAHARCIDRHAATVRRRSCRRPAVGSSGGGVVPPVVAQSSSPFARALHSATS